VRKEQIAIYGSGGFGREVAHWIEDCRQAHHNMHAVCFVDDNETKLGTTQNDLPVMGLAAARESFPRARIVGAIGSPQLRQRLMEKAAEAGFEFATVIHPRTECSRWVEIGSGTVLCAGTKLTTNIVLGSHVQLNMDCTIGHDVVMGDFTTLAPGVHVSGYVHLGKRVYVGTGAVFLHGTEDKPLVIGDDAVIGAGACVIRPVASGSTVVGVPASPLERKDTQT
jgi:sugar O-acyltransferase (sialic acid O-acetyltransferase NeuD family)